MTGKMPLDTCTVKTNCCAVLRVKCIVSLFPGAETGGGDESLPSHFFQPHRESVCMTQIALKCNSATDKCKGFGCLNEHIKSW